MSYLDRITISTPCQVEWSEMHGDDQIRFCDICRKNVYNFAAMDVKHIFSVIRQTKGSLCAQLHRRPDGTLVTKQCPPPTQRTRPFQYCIRTIMMLIAGCATLLGLGKQFSGREEPVTSNPGAQSAGNLSGMPSYLVEGGSFSLPEDLPSDQSLFE